MTREDSGKAVASLVFGILGLVGPCPLLGSILAVVLGQGEPGGTAKAGVVLGWVGIAVCALVTLAMIAMMVLGVGIAAVQGG